MIDHNCKYTNLDEDWTTTRIPKIELWVVAEIQWLPTKKMASKYLRSLKFLKPMEISFKTKLLTLDAYFGKKWQKKVHRSISF